jgi:hypothetical protein
MPAFSRYFFSIVVWASLIAVLPAQQLHDFDFHRLKGNWIKKSTSGTEIEHWEENNEGFTGYGAKIQNADTLITEALRIFKHNGVWQYEAKVKNQNQGAPVLFTLTQSGRNGFTFENPEHDFPQKIRYTFKKEGMRVALYGPSPKGKAITYFIDFKKQP